MSELDVQIAPDLQQDQSNDNIDSEFALVGGDTHSSLQQSDTNSEHQNSEHEPIESSNPNSSRGSTRATGEDDDAYSLISRNRRPWLGNDLNNLE